MKVSPQKISALLKKILFFDSALSRNLSPPKTSLPYKAKFDNAAFALLTPELQKNIMWPRAELQKDYGITHTTLGNIWKTIPGGHKWLDYFSIYDSEFSRIKKDQARVLEIGVYKGASLKMWSEFFGPESTIIGIDINKDCQKFDAPTNGIHVRIGNQADPAFLHSVIQEFGQFDLIIDDGSHVASHQIASFNGLFANGLRDNGIYFIEDLEGNYWGDTTGQLDQEVSTIDFLKMLIDMQNYIFMYNTYSDFALGSKTFKKEFSVPQIASQIESIKFYRGVAVIHKKSKLPPDVLHI